MLMMTSIIATAGFCFICGIIIFFCCLKFSLYFWYHVLFESLLSKRKNLQQQRRGEESEKNFSVHLCQDLS